MMARFEIAAGASIEVAEGKHAGRRGTVERIQGWRSWVWLEAPGGSEQHMIPAKSLRPAEHRLVRRLGWGGGTHWCEIHEIFEAQE